jgi:beta-lactamase regulating signal transducer with metallopeptidase domain
MIAILADAFVKATVILILAGVVTLLLRRSSASLRHLVWTLACGGVLALPLASALLPDWRVAGWPRLDIPVAFDLNEAPARQTVSDNRATPSPWVVTTQRNTPAPAPAAAAVIERSSTTAAGPVRWQITLNWTALILPVWLGGVAVVLMLLAVGMARIAWLDRVNEPVTDEAWLLLVDELSLEIGLTRRVRVLQADGPAMPMTWGMRRPAILLPAEADAWTPERRRDVLRHELAHVKRHDFLIQLIARVACAVYWFHPLVWLAATRLREERERACDDHVLRAGATPSVYATHLLDIARGLRAARATSLASVAMARPAQLATRLLDVLDTRRSRDTLSPRSAVPAWIAAIVVVVPLAAAAPRVAEPAATASASSIDTIPRVPAPRAKDPATRRPAVAVVAPDSLRGCGGPDTRRSSSHSHEGDEDVVTISITTGNCSITFDGDGKFTFTDDFTDIATLASDGRIVVKVDYGAHDRRLTITSKGSELERVFKVDGAERPYDAEARAWLKETLTFLLRRTGFMAEERARWILNTKGIQGLIDELGELSGDYTRRIYYTAAVKSGKLDAAGYERIVTMAGQTIDSDYELAELLIEVSKTQPLTEKMQGGFVTAAKSIESDYERHRVLSAALSRPGLTPAMQAGMLDAAAGIASDYELAELLIELNKARPIDEAARPAFFKAANSIESDYEHRRVLDAVVKRTGTSPAMLVDVLTSAKTIDSDYELAELLSEIGGSYLLDDALRPVFFTAANTLNSDYEHGRTLLSVVQRGDMPRPVTLAVLESAKGISSDNELAELLLAVIQRVKMDDTIRAALRTDAQAIGSQYDRGRVFEALGMAERD